jgi:hypothetical protein
MSPFNLFLLGIFLSTAAVGQDAITLSVQRYAQQGFGHPSLTLHPAVNGHIDVSLRCAHKRFSTKTAISPDTDITLDLVGLPTGQHNCTGVLTLTAADGTTGEMPLSINVGLFPALNLTVSQTDLDLDGRTLRLQSSRPLNHVAVVVLGPDGTAIANGETSGQNSDRVDLSWSLHTDEAVKLVVTATDTFQLSGQLDLSPWAYNIPHEDIVFGTGVAAVPSSESFKLEAAWLELTEVVQKYGKVVKVNLYIAGYTDTVGPTTSNQSLSTSRAQAIARWFRRRGFSGEIHTQGFGESVLAVPTPNETEHAENRRAIYMLAAQPPALSVVLPASRWTRLP